MTAYSVALVGNPNSGKTTLFNGLTGASQRVGNWPGVTVEKREGEFSCQGMRFQVTDLPGAYSLNLVAGEGTLDERIACEHVLAEKFDLIINVVDGNNLERNLYLTSQLLDMRVPLVLAVNMLDVAHKRGTRLDLALLARQLGCPVVGLNGKSRADLAKLKREIYRFAQAPQLPQASVPYPQAVRDIYQRLLPLVAESLAKPVSARECQWLTLRLLEGDSYASERLGQALQQQAQDYNAMVAAQTGEEIDILLPDARYRWAHALVQAVQTQVSDKQTGHRLDTWVLHRYWGIPIFLGIMYSMFFFAINVAGSLQDFFDIASRTLCVDGMRHLLQAWHAPAWVISVIANGVGTGINTTLTFVPVIGGMFVFLAFLEDSGYMARAAFVMDKCMCALGLPGKAFVPLIVGFGCNVPAVMATRTLENRRDRILTIMMAPFMSCGARLAIFAVFVAAFFPQGGQNVVFALYLIGIVVAVLTGFLLRHTLLPGAPVPMILELPPYHLPQLRSVLLHAWQRLQKFLSRAGRLVIPLCVVLGVLNSLSIDGGLLTTEADQDSLLSWLGKLLTPVFAPMGISQDNWPATVGLVSGVLAKEVVVATLNTLYTQVSHAGVVAQVTQFDLWGGLTAAWQSIFSNIRALPSALTNPVLASAAAADMDSRVLGVMYQYFGGSVAAFAYLLFVLLYMPCVSTVVVMVRELDKRWALFSLLWSTGIAYGVAVCFYQLATLQLHPRASLLWAFSVLALFLLTLWGLRRAASAPPAPALLMS